MAHLLNSSSTSGKKGQVLIELLIAIGVAVLLIPAIFSGFAAGREGRVQQNQRLQATALAEGALEAIRTVREADWENVETNGVYHPTASASSWLLASGSETIGDFTRSLTIGDVYRDASGNIAASGTYDPSVKKVDVSVTWPSFLPAEVFLTTYLTRLTSAEYVDTTVADFEAGSHDGTSVTNLSGGEVQLGGGGFGDWCDPNLTISALNLEGQGIAQGITAIEGQAFIGTGQNASGYALYKVDITDTDPPVATSPSNNWYSEQGNQDKTNGVFGESGYAYIATDTNSEELKIISTTNSPYIKVGYFNPSPNTDGNAVFVLGNVGYLAAANNTLYTFDLTSKTGSRPQVGSVALAGTPTKVYVVGTYAYVSISGNSSTEMQIVDVSTPSAMSVVGSANVNSASAIDVYVDQTGSRAYLATATSSSQKELFIIDVSIKTGSRPTLGSYDTNTMDPRGIRVVPGNRALIAGHGGMEYQVVNITDEKNPVQCGGLDVNFNINGLASVVEADGSAFSYLLTADANAEFRIIEGGPGGGFAATGTFTSRVFDTGKETAYNRFLVTFDEVVNSSVRFQIGAWDQISGSCGDPTIQTYVGPSGNSDTFYDDGGLIPFDDDGSAYENPARCFAYRAYFSSPVGTPILYDFTLSYSP